MAMKPRKMLKGIGLMVVLIFASTATAETRTKVATVSGFQNIGGGINHSLLMPDGSLADEISLLPGNYTLYVAVQLDYNSMDESSGSGSEALAARLLFVDPGRVEILSANGAVTSAAGCAIDGGTMVDSSSLLSDSLSEHTSCNFEGSTATSTSRASWSAAPFGIPINASVSTSMSWSGKGSWGAGSDCSIAVDFKITGANEDQTNINLVPLSASDLNADGCVDTADLGTLIAQFGSAGPDGDINLDGIVDTADLGQLIASFGDGCP